MKYILFVLLTFFAIFASANLNWVREIEDTQTATDGAGPQFVVTLDGSQVSNGELALMRNGYIHGLDSNGATVNMMTGEAVWNPLDFLGAAGWEFEVRYSPDGVKEYASSSATYTFVASDTEQYSIAFVASDEVISSSQDNAEAADCTRPTTAGYNFDGEGGSLSSGAETFAPTGLACASGYSGTVTATVCTAAEQPYSVSGCVEDVDCVETETIGTCSNGVQSVTYSDQTQHSGSGQACSSDTSQPCTGADGADCTDVAHCINECVSDVCATPSDCVETETVGACVNGLQDVTYDQTAAPVGSGAACSSDIIGQACTGADGDACTEDAHCINECDGSECVTPADCQETETVGACVNGLQDVTYDETAAPVGSGAVCSDDIIGQACTGSNGDDCTDNDHCVGVCDGGSCGSETDRYEIVTSGAPSLGLSKAQCARYASLLGVDLTETTGAVYGCSVKAGAVNYDSTTGENSADCGNAGNDCVECKEGETCAAGVVTGGGADAGTIQLTADADVDLLTLKLCDDTTASIAEIDDTGASYTMVHSLGLTYQRDNLDAEREPVTYCQDQEFVTSIARDASATTSVTTLISPALQRSIIVHGINWYQCPSTLLACQGSDECYQLKIDLSAREKNAEATSWSNASLSDSFQHQGGANTDSFDVVHSLSAATPGNLIQLVGQCGIIPNCSLSDPGVVNHWNDHTATDQDIVLRGTFEGSNVDSIASIETAFMECPLGATTDYNGELKLGLHLTCEDRSGDDAALQTIDSDITDENGVVQNCRSALTSSLVRVTTDVFVDTKDPTGKLAATGWEMKDVDFKFNRYEATVDGQKGKLISSDLMMQMRYQSGTEDWTCTRLKEKIQLLPVFDRQIMDCDITDLTTATNSATKTGLTHPEAGTIMFDLEPLREYSNDAYEVEVIAMLQNTALEQTRRLRTAYKLKTGGLANEETAFPLLNAADDDDHEHHDHEALVGLLIAVVCLLAVIGVGLFMCCRRKGMAAQLATVEEKQGLIRARPVRAGLRPRFKNLRY